MGLAVVGTTLPAPAQAGSPPLVRALQSDRLARAWGICTHYNFQHETYGHEVEVTNLLLDLGVRRIRNILVPGMAAQRHGFMRLAAAGRRVECRMGHRTDGETLAKARSVVNRRLDEIVGFYGGAASGLFRGLEGCNEPNNDGVPMSTWVRQTRNLQQAIWEESRKRPETRHIPVVGPALARPVGRNASTVEADYKAVGNLSPWADFGNIHVYPLGRSPSTDLDRFMAAARQAYPDGERLHTTEGGYFNALKYKGGSNPIPEDVNAKYAPRHVMEQVLRRNRRFFAYELLDDPDLSNSERESSFGYVRTPSLDPSTWTLKPQYKAMQNFCRLFTDRGPGFEPAGLRFSASGGGADYRSVLAQKRSGVHYICMWRDIDLYKWDVKTSTGTYLPVTPKTVTLQLATPAPVAIYKPTTQSGPVRSLGRVSSFSVALEGELVVAQVG